MPDDEPTFEEVLVDVLAETVLAMLLREQRDAAAPPTHREHAGTATRRRSERRSR
ncbi:MAG: hypothetical protein SFX73_17020 [Kofleriaceae bacterium]|nr:hypothetical protein [Kofleriaceae bacterium]